MDSTGSLENMCVMDLGASCCQPLTTPIGADCCRSPEQIDDDIAAPAFSADVWSLGAVLLQCLTGTPPYEGMRSMAMCAALLQGRPPGPIPGNIPNSLQRLLGQCFLVPAARRPTLANVKQVCWSRLRNEQGNVARTTQCAPSYPCTRPVVLFRKQTLVKTSHHMKVGSRSSNTGYRAI